MSASRANRAGNGTNAISALGGDQVPVLPKRLVTVAPGADPEAADADGAMLLAWVSAVRTGRISARTPGHCLNHLVANPWYEPCSAAVQTGVGAIHVNQSPNGHSMRDQTVGVPRPALPTRAVLVIDDDEPFRDALRELLEQRGLVVRVAADAHDGVRALHEMLFDAVFSDIKMPGGGGFLMLERTRKIQPQTPVILVTGSPADEWTTRAKSEGAFAYLTKPVGKDQILDVLRRAFERSRFAVRTRAADAGNSAR
jgi:CheY-like chemotaxis protein